MPTNCHSVLEDRIFNMYKGLALGRNATCQRCRETVSKKDFNGPISIWHVGDRFSDYDRRILFAGKTARGDDIGERENGVADTTSWSDLAILNTEREGAGSWPYWSYTRAIIETIYGSLAIGWEQVAFTNLLKCNCSPTVDTANEVMKTNCLVDLGVFRCELDIVQPRSVVLYVGTAYDGYLGERLLPGEWRNTSGTDRTTRVPCGRKTLPWWEGEVWRNGSLLCRVLRTGHPERMKKAEFVARVVQWLSSESRTG